MIPILTEIDGLDSEHVLALPLKEVLEALPRTEVVIPSDSAWKYSNLGFGLLGEVVSRLGRCSYDDYIRANILEPLDLESTSLDLTESMQQRAFCGYNLPAFQDRPETAPYAHLNGIAAAGQLHSTVADLARWVAFQFRGDGGARQGSQVLDGRTLNEMHRPQYVEPDWSAGQCLGWRAGLGTGSITTTAAASTAFLPRSGSTWRAARGRSY